MIAVDENSPKGLSALARVKNPMNRSLRTMERSRSVVFRSYKAVLKFAGETLSLSCATYAESVMFLDLSSVPKIHREESVTFW